VLPPYGALSIRGHREASLAGPEEVRREGLGAGQHPVRRRQQCGCTLAVGVLAKPGAIKTVIQSDTANVHAYENCELADWVDVK